MPPAATDPAACGVVPASPRVIGEALYVGTANSQAADGSNAFHLVADEVTWRARCGKVVAEAWGPVTAAQAREDVTCRTCRRGLQ